MTKLSRGDILKLAKLARLKLDEDEVNQFQGEITNILSYAEQLGSLQLDEFEPTSQVTGLTNVMRPDEVKDYKASPTELLKNAPGQEKGLIKVAKII